MVILAIVLGIILVLLFWILAAPLSLRIDTYRGEYWLKWWGIGSVEAMILHGDIVIHLQAGPWGKDFFPLQQFSERSARKAKQKAKHQKKKRRSKISFRKAMRMLKTFTVKEFSLDLDTGDYVWDAWLFSLLYAIQPLRQRARINFQGRNECRLEVENRLWKLGWAALR